MEDYYAYIFVRQDIPAEQQLIQFGHVACVLGDNLPAHVCPRSLSFVGIGVADEEALVAAKFRMKDNDIRYHFVREPDINDELTAVASHPISGSKREVFKGYKTLKFSS